MDGGLDRTLGNGAEPALPGFRGVFQLAAAHNFAPKGV
jgi:hypothetical protein